jgi:Telomere resolvase
MLDRNTGTVYIVREKKYVSCLDGIFSRKELLMPKSILGWVRDRWSTELEPVLRVATVAQEKELRVFWEQELAWWKGHRHLDGDSLRNPLTNVRTLIKQLPLTDENSYVNPQNGQQEHIGLAVFNLAEGEWVSLNDRQRAQTQKRLEQEVFISEPDAVVQRALPLLLSDEWAELVVAIAICTGRRLAEIMKSGTFTRGEGYTVWFEGQLKASNRADRFEIPTLARSFLVVDAVEHLRRLVDCSPLEIDQVSQKFGKAVNETVDRVYRDLIPVRVTKENKDAGPTIHVLRSVYAHIAVLWYDPPPVDPINYMAQIQGHRFITDPQVPVGASEEEVHGVQLNYASHANYADYQILGTDGQVDGRRGIKLGTLGVTVLGHYDAIWQQWLKGQGNTALPLVRKGKKRGKPADQNKTGFSALRPLVWTKDWVDELRDQTQQLLKRPEVKDDEIVRRMAAAYAVQLAGLQGKSPAETLSLESLNIDPELRALLLEGMALSGAADLLAFLLAAGEQSARQLRSVARKSDTHHYAEMPTSKLLGPNAAQERLRRGLYAVMHFNEQMAAQGRYNDLWFITVQMMQNLLGGRKDAIKAYLEAHQEEISAHHIHYDIKSHLNRKAQSPREAIPVPEDPKEYPWAEVAEVPASAGEASEAS